MRLEPVRSALPPSSSGRAAVKAPAPAGWPCGWPPSRPWCGTDGGVHRRLGKVRGQVAFMRRVNSAASSGGGLVGGKASRPRPAGGVAGGAWRPSRRTPRRDDEGRVVPAQRFAVSLISSAPSGSPWALAVLARLGEPLPMCVLQMTSVGRSASASSRRRWPRSPCRRHGRRSGRSRSSHRRQKRSAVLSMNQG